MLGGPKAEANDPGRDRHKRLFLFLVQGEKLGEGQVIFRYNLTLNNLISHTVDILET